MLKSARSERKTVTGITGEKLRQAIVRSLPLGTVKRARGDGQLVIYRLPMPANSLFSRLGGLHRPSGYSLLESAACEMKS